MPTWQLADQGPPFVSSAEGGGTPRASSARRRWNDAGLSLTWRLARDWGSGSDCRPHRKKVARGVDFGVMAERDAEASGVFADGGLHGGMIDGLDHPGCDRGQP